MRDLAETDKTGGNSLSYRCPRCKAVRTGTKSTVQGVEALYLCGSKLTLHVGDSLRKPWPTWRIVCQRSVPTA